MLDVSKTQAYSFEQFGLGLIFERYLSLRFFIVPCMILLAASSFFACPKNEAKKDTFLRSFPPQAKGQPRGEKIANAPTLPHTIEVITTLLVAYLFCVTSMASK